MFSAHQRMDKKQIYIPEFLKNEKPFLAQVTAHMKCISYISYWCLLAKAV